MMPGERMFMVMERLPNFQKAEWPISVASVSQAYWRIDSWGKCPEHLIHHSVGRRHEQIIKGQAAFMTHRVLRGLALLPC